MPARRTIQGFAIIGTVIGAFLGNETYEHQISGRALFRWHAERLEKARNCVIGAVVGAVCGIIIDCIFCGLPRRRWSFTLKEFLLAVMAFGILTYGLICFWQMLTMPP